MRFIKYDNMAVAQRQLPIQRSATPFARTRGACAP
jgi:hypothetical protein